SEGLTHAKETTPDVDGESAQVKEAAHPSCAQIPGGRQGQGTCRNRPQAEVHPAAAEEGQVQLHHRRDGEMAWYFILLLLYLRLPRPHGDFTNYVKLGWLSRLQGRC